MAILELQPLVTAVAYKKTCIAITAKEIIHSFMSTNFVRTKRQKLVKYKRRLRKFWGCEVQTQKITVTIIYIYFIYKFA